jgi:VWFA-related protein
LKLERVTRLVLARAARLMAGLAALALALGAAGFSGAALPAWAQDAGPTVVITSVDSADFPTVTAHFTVNGANGLPLVGLAPENFVLTEDGRPVDARGLSLNSDISQPLNLVLAVDVSTAQASLDQTRAAAIDFVNALGPNDLVAVIAYHDQVQDVASFSSDRAALTSALQSLTAAGNATVFNAAVDRGVTLLRGQASAGRKAVILFTNSGDTTNNLSPEPILAAAEQAQVRIYPMAYGPNINAELMNNWARFSGGQAYLLPAASDIGPNLLTLGVLMRQSYALTFESGLTADNRPHTLRLALTYQGQTAQADAQFTGVPSPVVVEGPGLSNGQTVRGRVFLVADVSARAPIRRVSFWLNDQLLAELTTTPYRFDWDSTTADPGTHTLRITAVDAAGNQGETQVTVNVALPPPIVVTATPVPTVAAPSGPSQVQVFAQNALRVAGQVLAGLALFIGLIVALVLWTRSLRVQRAVQVKSCDVELMNLGNSRSRYELRAEDPSGHLKFQFALHDASLVQRADLAATAAAPAGGAAQPAGAGQPRGSARDKVYAGVRQGQRAVGVMENITSWLMNVAYLLPGRGGQQLRSQVSQSRSVQYDAHEALEKPGRIERVVKSATPTVPGGGPHSAPANQPARAGTASGNGHAAAATLPAPGGTLTAGAGQSTVLASAGAQRPGWSVTPYVEPGQSLVVQLLVSPTRAPRSQHYAFRVLSRTAEAEGGEPLVEHGTVALRGLPILRRAWTLLLLVLSAALLALLVWYLLVVFGVV